MRRFSLIALLAATLLAGLVCGAVRSALAGDLMMLSALVVWAATWLPILLIHRGQARDEAARWSRRAAPRSTSPRGPERWPWHEWS